MPPSEPDRPDPDQLLLRVQSEEAQRHRGRLKIWLGSSPGVGKTFAMLSAAHRLAAQGVDVVIGLVETHGRADTQRLTQGLPQLPRRTVEYRGTTLTELDLDAAIARQPAVVLVDELAHTNAPGSRFEKRWQDVRALLDAGIAVHTTLNVQHIESLVDVVARVTGVTMRETVPDAVLDDADEVEIVDLAPDALLERLHAGKVYIPEAARAAAQSFFKKANLAALRELALRKTAALVDRRRRDDRLGAGGRNLRTTGERLLVCVGPSPLSARLVRAAHRMTAVLRGELFAVYVSPPDGGRLGAAARDRVLQNLRLAESLGARTATIEGTRSADAVVDFAVKHEISRIVVGKTGRGRLREALFGSFTTALIRASRDIDVYVIHGENDGAPGGAPGGDAAPSRTGTLPALASWRRYAQSLLVTTVAVLVSLCLYEPPDLSAEALLLILGVVLTALRCGRGPSLLSALLNALAFNFLMVEPRYSFAVAEPAYLIAFVTMAVVGVSLSSLVATARERADDAKERESELAALLSLTRELADAATVEQIGRVVTAHLRDLVRADLAVLVAPPGEALGLAAVVATHGATDWIDSDALAVARWSHDHGKPAGAGTSNLPGTRPLFVPMRSHRGKEGVLGLHLHDAAAGLLPKQRLLVETFAEQAAAACERASLAAQRQRAEQEAAAERLRSTLLASVSHDLRTPLTTITGAASSLVQAPPADEATRRTLAASILAEANRLNDLIANLVFATRLEGGIELRTQCTSVEEVLGAALRRAGLAQHPVDLHVAADLPFVEADPVLLEQAFYNLLENAARHTPPGTRVTVRAFQQDARLVVEVADDGPGIAAAAQGDVFRRFVRGKHSAGMGLGLAIVDGIAKAHGGRAWLEPGRAHGAAFRVALPLPARQPAVPRDSEEPTRDSGALPR